MAGRSNRPVDMDCDKVPQPCCIQFQRRSNERVHAFRRILDAFGGTLPADVVVCFANTGKEREEHCRVEDCGDRWGVKSCGWSTASLTESAPTNKFRSRRHPAKARFEELIRAEEIPSKPGCEILHNADTKIRTINRQREGLGWTNTPQRLGFAPDEPRRLAKLAKLAKSHERGENCSLGSARITEQTSARCIGDRSRSTCD